MARTVAAVLAIVLVTTAAPAAVATFSVVAADAQGRLVGAAGASCVAVAIDDSFRSAPGWGAVVAQAYFSMSGRDHAAARLGAGATPSEIVGELANPGFDPGTDKRQYGVVDFKGRTAVYTGRALDPWSGGRHGRSGPVAYAIQGNFLSGAEVLAAMERELLGSEGPFEDRLLGTLEAGARGGEGDARCRSHSIPATAAYLTVEDERGGRMVHLTVLVRNGESALVALRRQYDEWRRRSPPAKRRGHGCAGAASCTFDHDRGDGPGGVAVVLAAALALLARRRR